MRKYLLILIVILLPGYAIAQTVFRSNQVGTVPSNGYVLQTNGATSSWVATSSLGISGNIGTGTTGQFPYYAANGTTLTATSSLFLDTNQKIGIGTITPNNKLTVVTATQAASNSAIADSADFGIYDSGVTARFALIGGQQADFFLDHVGAATDLSQSQILNQSGFTSILAYTDAGAISQRLFTGNHSTGAVGIGLAAPTQRFHVAGVAGNAATSGTTQNGMFRLTNASNALSLDFGQQSVSPFASWIQNSLTSDLGAEFPLSLQPNGGSVTVNHTGTPQALVDVACTTYPCAALGFRKNGSGDWGITLGSESVANVYIGVAGSTSAYYWRANWNTAGVAGSTFRNANTAATTISTMEVLGVDSQTADIFNVSSWAASTTPGSLFTVEANGNVGIGLVAPTAALHVSTSSAATSTVKLTNSATGALVSDGFDINMNPSGIAEIRNRENTAMDFFNNNARVGQFAASGGLWLPTSAAGTYLGFRTGGITSGFGLGYQYNDASDTLGYGAVYRHAVRWSAGESYALVNAGNTADGVNTAQIVLEDVSPYNVGFSIKNPDARLHLNVPPATANALKFTASTTTGVTSADGFDVGITTTGAAEIRQRESTGISVYANNSLISTWVSGTPIFTTFGYIQAQYNGIANTSTDGFLSTNLSSATVGTPIQRPGRIRQSGHVWDTGAVATRIMDWKMEPVFTSGNPGSSIYSWDYQYNSGGYSTLMSLSSDGNLGIGTTTPSTLFQINSTAATSTISSTVVNGSVRSTTLGGRIILQDTTGGTCTEVTSQSGVLNSKAVTCP